MRAVFLSAVILAGFSPFFTHTTAAQTPNCPRPAVPACALNDLTFNNADQMVVCQGLMKEYLDVMPRYQECLQREQLMLSNQMSGRSVVGGGSGYYEADLAQINAVRNEQLVAGQEMVDVARRFNCRLMNQGNCQ